MKLREEELDAKFVLERMIYPDKRLFILDKPDIRDKAETLGVEHRLVTTPDAMLMEKMLEEYLELHEAEGGNAGADILKSKYGALMIENGLLTAADASHEKKRKLGMLAFGLREKLEKLNNGDYRTFARNELFLTMRELSMDEDVVRNFAVISEKIGEEYAIRFDRIYVFTLQWLYLIETGKISETMELNEATLLEMEKETARLMEEY